MAKHTVDPRQLSLDFDAPAPVVEERSPEPAVEASATPIADLLIEKGFVTEHALQLNRGIDCGEGPAPSRAYRWPFRYMGPCQIYGPERLFAARRELIVTDTAKRVLDLLGDRVEFTDGSDIENVRGWHHAVDLMSEEHVGHLLATRHLTTSEKIAGAVSFHLWSSDRPITLATARRVLDEIGVPEPEDRSASVFTSPDYPHLAAKSSEGPTVNLPRDEIGGWCAIHGIEDGWMVARKNKFLAPAQKLLQAQGV